MIPMSVAPTGIGNDGRGVAAPGCRVRQFSHRDSLRTLSGIRLPTRSAIVAGPMTGRVKSMRSELRTHCRHGHSLDENNTYISPQGRRDCKICRALSAARHRLRSGVDPNFIPPGERTHCPKGHPYSPDNTRIHKQRGFRICIICAREGVNRSAAQRITRRTAQGLSPYPYKPFGGASANLTEDQIRSIATRLRDGETMTQITQVNPVCDARRLQAFRHKYARLWKPLDKLAAANRTKKWTETILKRRRLASIDLSCNDGIDAFESINAATRQLPDFLRDDVRSAMFLAAAERRLKPRDAVKRLREFVTAHNRQFSKYVPGGGGIMRSLDEQVYDDGPTRLVDTVTHGLWQ